MGCCERGSRSIDDLLPVGSPFAIWQKVPIQPLSNQPVKHDKATIDLLGKGGAAGEDQVMQVIHQSHGLLSGRDLGLWLRSLKALFHNLRGRLFHGLANRGFIIHPSSFIISQFRQDAAQVVHDVFEFAEGLGGEDGRLGEVGAGFGAVVFEPGDVEAVVALGDPLAGEFAEASGFAVSFRFFRAAGLPGIGAKGGLELG
jgi:hypothetical protein